MPNSALPLNSLFRTPPVGRIYTIEGTGEEIPFIHLLDFVVRHVTLVP